MVEIKAILFDLGGTLVYRAKKDSQNRLLFLGYLMTLLDVDQSQDEFYALLRQRFQAYKKWSEKTSRELSEEAIWTHWMLPDWPEQKISRLAPQLNHWWRAIRGINLIPPDMQSTLIELVRRGYLLGLISNTTSPTEGIRVLESHGLAPYFGSIVLSTVCGYRKPGPEIFQHALVQLGISAQEAVYIGDRPDRDVLGARRTGITTTIIIRLTEPFDLAPAPPDLTPTYLIHSLSELLELFPTRKSHSGVVENR